MNLAELVLLLFFIFGNGMIKSGIYVCLVEYINATCFCLLYCFILCHFNLSSFNVLQYKNVTMLIITSQMKRMLC